MFSIVTPVFLVVFLGYCFGKIKPNDENADKLINDYVLYIALPALLFFAIAKADMSELKQWGFILSTLMAIALVYLTAELMARHMKIGFPQSSILSMGASYGTTGYMGMPILISVYGEKAALPASIATILHNIPTIIAVIISWELFSIKEDNKNISSIIGNLIRKILKTTFTNPLVISVIIGLIFVLLGIKLPNFLAHFANFLGNAAGPTALFALGLGLAKIHSKQYKSSDTAKIIIPLIFLKIVIQPLFTFIIAAYLFGMDKNSDIWLAVAVVMAAQPIGAGVYVFAKKYDYCHQKMIPISIIISLLISLITIPIVLSVL